MALKEFTGELDAPKLKEFTGLLDGEVAPGRDEGIPLVSGDPMGMGGADILAAAQQPKPTSVLEGVRFDGPEAPAGIDFKAASARSLAQARKLPVARAPSEAQPSTPVDQTFLDNATRVLRKTLGGINSGTAGIIQMVGDVTGMDSVADFARTSGRAGKRFANKTEAGKTTIEGFTPNSPVQGLPGAIEDAAVSIGQQVPALATGNLPAALAMMFGQSTGTQYGEVREKGLDIAPAIANSVLTGAAEVIGEKLGGTPGTMRALKGAVAGNAPARVAAEMARAGVRDIPGESLTTLMQYGTDAAPVIGTNAAPSFGELGGQLKNTVAQTLLQGGMMTGGGAALASAAQKMGAAPKDGQLLPAVNSDFAAKEMAREIDAAAQEIADAPTPLFPQQTTIPKSTPAKLRPMRADEALDGEQPAPRAAQSQSAQAATETIAKDSLETPSQTSTEQAAPAIDQVSAPAPANGGVQRPGAGPALEADRTEPTTPTLSEPTNVQNQVAAGAPAQAQAAPDQAPAPAGSTGGGQAAAGTQTGAGAVQATGINAPAAQTTQGQDAIENIAPQRIGRNNVPMAEGGKPFKTNMAAKEARKLQPGMRVIKVDGGYALAEKTRAQLAAQEKAARRMGLPQTSARGEPIPAHAFIASAGGLAGATRSDMNMQGNVRIGNRSLFAGTGKGLTIERATEKLIEEGYLPEGAGHDQARELIKRSLKDPQYTPEGVERMAEKGTVARFEDHLAAQQEAAESDPDFDPFPDMDIQESDFAGTGFAEAPNETQLEVQALIAMADERGIDSETIMLDAHDATREGTTQDFYDNAKSALEAAIGQGRGDSRPDSGQQGDPPAEGRQQASEDRPDEGLTSYTEGDVLARLDALEKGEKDTAAKDAKADADAKKERERRDIASRQQASSDNFELGQSADDAISGQGRMFAESPQVGYDGNYEKDLFGDPLPVTRRKDRPAEPKRAGVSGDVRAAGNVQADIAGSEFYANAFVGSETSRELGAAVVSTPTQAAQATQYLYKSAVERFDAIVTDKAGKPLGVVGGFKGALAQTSVYPATLVGEAIRIPGAARIWFSHNHPSGSAMLSRADEHLNRTLTDIFNGSGIEPMGLMAIAGETFSYVDALGDVTESNRPIPAPSDKISVPVMERQLMPGALKTRVDNPSDAKKYAKQFYEKSRQPGMMLLDSQMGVAAWVPIPPKMRGQLRDTGQLAALYRAVSQSNAGTAILAHGGELDVVGDFPGKITAGNNVAAALQKVDVRVVDSINVNSGVSRAETGQEIALGPMYSRPKSQDAAPAAFRQVKTKSGATGFLNADIALGSPRLNVRQPGGNVTRIDFDIRDTAAFTRAQAEGMSNTEAREAAHVGILTMDMDKAGQFKSLRNIEIFQSKRGNNSAEKVVGSIIASLPPGGKLHIHDILPTATGFWDKMGAKFPRSEDFMEAYLTPEQYKAAYDTRPRTAGARGQSQESRATTDGTGRGRRSGADGKDVSGSQLAKDSDRVSTPDQVRAVLAARFGPLAARMEARGFLKIWDGTQEFNQTAQRSEQIEGKAQGLWDGNTAHLFADAIEPGTEIAVLLHEVGEHASMKQMLGDEKYAQLVKRARALTQADDPTALEAVARIPDDTRPEFLDSELLAYMIETVAAKDAKASPSARKWLADILAAIRAWWTTTGLSSKLQDSYGLKLDLTPEDIAALAVRAVKWQGQQSGQKQGRQMSRPASRAQTDTPAFKDWFDGSKVVDAQGKPMVMYHGTSASEGGDAFTMVDTYASSYGLMGMGGYFTADPEIANSYTTKGRGGSPTVYPVYLSIKNPIDMEAKADVAAWEKQFDDIAAYHEGGESNESWYRAAESMLADQDLPSYEGAEVMQDGLRSMGFDGITHMGGGRVNKEGARHRVYVTFDPEQSKSATGNIGTFDKASPDLRYSVPKKRPLPATTSWAAPPGSPPVNPAAGGVLAPQPWTVSEPGAGDAFIRGIQNNKIDMKRVRDAIAQQFGRVPEALDPYLGEELYQGKVAARVTELHENTVEPILKKIAVAGANAGVTLDDVNQYLHARHAPERNAAMKAINPNMPNNDALSGMSDADAATVMAGFRTAGKDAALALIVKDIDQLNADTRTALVADGLEDAATVQAWEAAYKFYAPLQRDVKSSGTPKGMGFSVRGPEAKRAVGSNKDVVNILANIVAQAETAAIRAEKAKVGRALLEMAKAYPNPNFWKVDQAPTKPRIDPKTGLVIRGAVDPMYQTADNVLMVKDYGMEHFIVFNKDSDRAMLTARAMKNLDAAPMNKILEVASKGTRFIASLLTQRNPLFWMTNFARDIQGALINLEGTDAEGLQAKVLGNLGKSFKGMHAIVRGDSTGQWARYAKEMQEAGGTTGYMQQFENSDARMKNLQREVDRMAQGKADPRKLGRMVLDFVDDYNDIIENAVRLSVFQTARQAGASTMKAASIAKNITVNFNRKGNLTPPVNALYMFFNASVQGTARLTQALVTSPKAQALVGGIAIMGFVLDALNRAMSDDDEETGRNRYDLIPEFEKSKNWIFMNPMRPGEYVKVPLPLGPHVFHNAGRLISDAIFRKDPRNASEYGWSMASTVLDAFSPLGATSSVGQLIAPSILDPVVQIAENKSFTGGPVYKSKDRGFGHIDPKPAYTRFFENTPDLWKAASKGLNDISGGDKVKPGLVNIEPDILKSVFYTMTGGPGRTLDQALDATQSQARGDTPTVNRIPFASRFYGTNDDRQRERAYYDDRKRVADAKTQFDYFVKSGRADLAREVATELGEGNPAKGRKMMLEFKTAGKTVGALNKQIRAELEQQEKGGDRSEQIKTLKARRVKVMGNAVRDEKTEDE